jgi:ketosteroid isomerase-like protein
MALDKQAQEAYAKGDSKFFETFLSDKFMMGGMKGKPVDKAATVKEIANVKCENAKGDFTEPQMTKIDNDTYAITYKASWEGTCTENGKSMKIPGPMRASSIYIRNGDKWQGAWHGETMIVEPKGEAKKEDSSAKPADSKKADAASSDSAPSAIKKDDAAKPAESKKEDKAEAKKEEPKKDGTTDTNSAPAAEAKPDANTDALMKLHQAGWDAWRTKDAKTLSDMTTASLAVVDPMGGWHGEKEEIIKFWTAEDCKDVKTAKFNDGFAFALSPTVEVLMGRGTADGTCNGQKNGTLNQTAVYVKEGAGWKLAFMFESPAA